MKRLTSPVPMWFMLIYMLADITTSLIQLGAHFMGWK